MFNSIAKQIQIGKSLVIVFLVVGCSFLAKGSATLDTLHVFMSSLDWNKLEYLRSKIIQSRTSEVDRDFVPCVLRFNKDILAGKIKLKGDRLVHFEEGKASFRLELNGDNGITGIKTFSIHKPRAKNYTYESLFHFALKREGLIGLRYRLIRLFINDRDFGIYALEEFMSKELIENNRRREGPILHFSEDSTTRDVRLMEVQIFGKAAADSAMYNLQQEAQRRLTDFKMGRSKASELFDLKQLGKFIALTDVLGFHHSVIPQNIRFYYNPITRLFEPIGYDGHLGTETGTYLMAEMGINPKAEWFYELLKEWFQLIFSDPGLFDRELFSSYINNLEKMSAKTYLDSLFIDFAPLAEQEKNELNGDLTPPLTDNIYSFGPDTFKFSTEIFYSRTKTIRNILAAKDRLSARILRSHDGRYYVGVRVTERLPVELMRMANGKTTIDLDGLIVLPKEKWMIDTLYQPLPVMADPRLLQGSWFIEYHVVGAREIGKVRLIDGTSIPFVPRKPEKADAFVFQKGKSDPVVEHPFLRIIKASNEIEFLPGQWKLNRPLILPAGYVCRVRAGFELELSENGSLVFYSPVNFQGTSQMPIRIRSTVRGYGNVLILSNSKQNILAYTEFIGLGSRSPGRILTGAVTFYESPVNISSCKFIDCQAEDALNIVRSKVDIRSIEFVNAYSDALDGDFISGSLQDIRVVKCTNDGIDVSGSEVIMKNIKVLKAGDKGISCGEQSKVVIENAQIDSSRVGMACKDDSHLRISQSFIGHGLFGLVAYQKKFVFRQADIFAEGLVLNEVKMNYSIEPGCKVTVNGKVVDQYDPFIMNKIYDR